MLKCCGSGVLKATCQTCLNHIIRDSSFTCNARWLYDAFSSSSWMMQYNFPVEVEAFHATDLIPLYMNNFSDAYNMISTNIPPTTTLAPRAISLLASGISQRVMPTYQAYMGSFAVNGDPNPGRLPAAPSWSLPVSATTLGNVMDVSEAFGWRLTTDSQTAEDRCAFWQQMATMVEGSMKAKTGVSRAPGHKHASWVVQPGVAAEPRPEHLELKKGLLE